MQEAFIENLTSIQSVLKCETHCLVCATASYKGRFIPVLQVSKLDIAFSTRNHHTAAGNRMPYGITHCYLPPSSRDFPAFTPARAGTRFKRPPMDAREVDLGDGYIPRLFTYERQSPISKITGQTSWLEIELTNREPP